MTTQKVFYTIVALLLSILVITFSCGSEIKVVPLTQEAKDKNIDVGIPYYLPKPYLLITRNVIGDNIPSTQNTTGGYSTSNGSNSLPARDMISCRVIYLPDTSEKYGIQISDGIGTFESNITIEDGWKFTGINVKTDSKTAETLKAVAEGFKVVVPAVPIRERNNQKGPRDKKDDNEDKEIVSIDEKSLAKSITQTDAEILLYDLANLSKPVFQWPTPNQ